MRCETFGTLLSWLGLRLASVAVVASGRIAALCQIADPVSNELDVMRGRRELWQCIVHSRVSARARSPRSDADCCLEGLARAILHES